MKLREKIRIIFIIFLLLFIGITFFSYELLTNKIMTSPRNPLLYYFIITSSLALLFFVALFLYLKKFLLSRLDAINAELLKYKSQKNMQSPLEQNLPTQPTKTTEKHISPRSEAKEQKTSQDESLHISSYDNLTNLPNRVFFNEILNKAISHAKRRHSMLAVVLIDIDHFDIINKTYDKEIGDSVLQELAKRLKSILRSDDVLARCGGDEFNILLNTIEDPKYAGPVAEKILQSCKQPLIIDDYEINVKASIGISVYPNDGESLEELQKKADSALFKAKRLGGGLYQYFRQELDIAAHEHIKMENALRNAIENNELVLYFQPQLSLENGTIKAVEALIRWEHPQLGLLSPEKFIPLAEETGLILPIGAWALQQACKINKEWQNAGYEPMVVSVNISSVQFKQQDLSAVIKEILATNKLAAKYLEIEITETTVMDNIPLAVDKLTDLHKMGISIALDDFGTGYTSINYLRQFPINVLKIDQTFIKGIPHNQNDLAITSAVISLGHNLGLDIVAEGVETIEQIQYLAEHNCDLIQGYFLSRPLPAAKIILQFSKKGSIQEPVIQN